MASAAIRSPSSAAAAGRVRADFLGRASHGGQVVRVEGVAELGLGEHEEILRIVGDVRMSPGPALKVTEGLVDPPPFEVEDGQVLEVRPRDFQLTGFFACGEGLKLAFELADPSERLVASSRVLVRRSAGRVELGLGAGDERLRFGRDAAFAERRTLPPVALRATVGSGAPSVESTRSAARTTPM